MTDDEKRAADAAMKAAVKEGLREWLDEKYSAFGRFSLHGLMAAGLGGLVFLALWSQGWHK